MLSRTGHTFSIIPVSLTGDDPSGGGINVVAVLCPADAELYFIHLPVVIIIKVHLRPADISGSYTRVLQGGLQRLVLCDVVLMNDNIASLCGADISTPRRCCKYRQ